MLSLRTAVSVVVLALGTALIPSPTASATTPDASVHINRQAFEGPRGSILASLRARCAPGFEVDRLEFEFAQGPAYTSPRPGSAFPCDGRWHRQRVSSDEGFDPGPATMTVRLSVVEVGSGEPGRPATETQSIYVRPAAKVRLPRHAVLERHHVVRMVVRARCDRPWVEPDFSIELAQNEFPNMAQDSLNLPGFPPCDGTYHRVVLRFRSMTETPFRRGWVQVQSFLSVLDPVFFDPVAQDRAARLVKVR